MESFGEFNNRTSTGTYVGVKFTDISLDTLDSMKLGLGLQNPLDRSKQHITLLYSRNPVVIVPKNYTASVKPVRVESWENSEGGYYVVVVFESKELVDRHDHFINMGGTHDYPDYHVHTTLSYNEPNKIYLDLSDLNITMEVDSEYVQELDLDWKK